MWCTIFGVFLIHKYKIKVQLWKNSIEHMVEIINNKIDDLMMCWWVLLMDDIFVKVEVTIQGE